MVKKERLIMAIDEELKAKLQQAADSAGISMSEYIRRLITGSVEWDTGKITFKRE
jgi:antitoxin component of RelBE/YafQ-DinJ toxin-antitoxin module